MKVIALTGGRNLPSARFRVRQYREALATHGVAVREHPPMVAQNATLPGVLSRVRPRYLGPLGVALIAAHYAGRIPGVIASRFADLVWLQRDLLRWGVSFEPWLGRPLVFDFDDAIWLKRPATSKLVRLADAVFAGNRFLADWASQHTSCVHIVPTAIDIVRFQPITPPEPERPFIVGWTGSSPNLRYLESISRPLRKVLKAIPRSRLRIICDRRPDLPDLPAAQVEFIEWSADTEVTALQPVSVGIMPLTDGDWERGKCSFKMLQYMACGLPVVVSPVGMNQEVLAKGDLGLAAASLDDWYDALLFLANNPVTAATMGRTGRKVVDANYSVESVAEQIASLFRNIKGGATPIPSRPAPP